MPGDFTQGSGFRICGSVVRRFIPQSRKIAFLTLDVARPRSGVKLDLRTFDHGLIDDIGALVEGQLVEVTGAIDVEPVKDKAGKEVKVDGYNKWTPALTIKVLRAQPASAPGGAIDRSTPSGPPPEDVGPGPVDDDVPF